LINYRSACDCVVRVDLAVVVAVVVAGAATFSFVSDAAVVASSFVDNGESIVIGNVDDC
jgi:hypothetical protein